MLLNSTSSVCTGLNKTVIKTKKPPNNTSGFFYQQCNYATDQFTMPLYAVPSTTSPNTMRYQANTVKSWWLM